MSNDNSKCPDALTCPIMQNDMPMQDPVLAADGFTYERGGIERWLVNNITSPMTRGVMANKDLIPNKNLKSQTEQWKEEQKGVNGRLSKLEQLFTQVLVNCETSEESAKALSTLSEFIINSETPLIARRLKMLRNVLEPDEKLWSDTVNGILEVMETQCQAVMKTVQGKLWKAKLLHDVTLKINKRALIRVTSKRKELEETVKRMESLKAQVRAERSIRNELQDDFNLYYDEQNDFEKILN